MLYGDSVCVCMYVSNATGMQLLQTHFLWAQHCLHVQCTMEPKSMPCTSYDGVICREAMAIREATCTTTQK